MLCAISCLERERAGARSKVGLPIRDVNPVLRRTSQRLARYDVLARDRIWSELHPYLPVNIEIAECQMLAFDSIDDASTNILCLNDAIHQGVVRLGQQQIGKG